MNARTLTDPTSRSLADGRLARQRRVWTAATRPTSNRPAHVLARLARHLDAAEAEVARLARRGVPCG